MAAGIAIEIFGIVLILLGISIQLDIIIELLKKKPKDGQP